MTPTPTKPMTSGSRWQRVLFFATVFVVGAIVLAAFFDNVERSRNWDPQQARNNVERTLRYGGTFFENALINKGPLEPTVYRLAAAITTWDGFWYAISFFVLIVSALIAWASSRTAQVMGAHRYLGAAVGIGVFYHFTLGKADYAGVLYSRNMIVGLFAAAWLVALSPRAWTARRARWSALVIGALLGLALQTLLVCAVAAVGVGWVAWSEIDDIEDESIYRRCRRTLIMTPILVTLAAPLYYFARGRFEEFWSGWWTYALFMNKGTGRSLANQLILGRDSILRYYRAWPVSLIIVVTFAVLTIGLWRALERRERAIHFALWIWFFGAWTELVLGQRYSSHYFSILAVPTALMAAASISHVYCMIQRERGDFRTVVAWPLVASILVITSSGGPHFDAGLKAASKFTSVHQAALQRDANQPGNQRTVRATLDLVSKADDPLLAWTEFPWTYLDVRRVSAARDNWKSFLLGQIYLGRSGPQYVLPKTWQWFADDMRQAKPAAFLEETAMPLTQGNPFADYVAANFTMVYAGKDFNISLRNDQAHAVVSGDRGAVFTPVAVLGSNSNWTVQSNNADRGAHEVPSQDDDLLLSSSLCTRISGTYLVAPGADGSFLSFKFTDPKSATDHMRLNIVNAQVMSGNDTTVFDSVSFGANAKDATEATVADLALHTFAVVVGKSSAALVIDGAIRSAVRLTNQTRLSLEVRSGGVKLSDLHVGAPPPESGCGG